ncbi:MAG: nucleotide exchange factor GrpE [Synergistaceae bacterium]|jgi:molecular chaperone GrpE|nr:nucleotide exchange factor GrpE [Synergistaceae bacterium]
MMSAERHDASAGRAEGEKDKSRADAGEARERDVESAGRPDEPNECGADAASLAKQLEEARREAEEYKDEAVRAKADFYNYRARVERDRARDRALAAEGAVDALLPVLDNFERALGAVQDRDSAIYKGVSMVQRQFFSALQSLGLKTIEAAGRFDPALHEAVMAVDVESDEENGAILEQLHVGYMLGDKVLRASQVKVGRKRA